MNYCQCKLKKSNTYQVAWIPEKKSKIGKVLRIKNDNGWEVIEVGPSMDYKEVNDRSQDYKKQRRASDV